jgi:hypothetical protein
VAGETGDGPGPSRRNSGSARVMEPSLAQGLANREKAVSRTGTIDAKQY